MTAIAPDHRSAPTTSQTPPMWADVDRALADLYARKNSWVQVSLEERIALLATLRRALADAEERWITASLEAKGLAPGGYGEGEERTWFTILTRTLRLLHQALIDIRDHGRPQLPGVLTSRPNGQSVAPVLPMSRYDAAILPRMTGEVWIEPGLTADEVLQQQANVYQTPAESGRVALVLNASTSTFLPVTDILHKLFVTNDVVALKLHPAQASLSSLFEETFRPLLEYGVVCLVYGDHDLDTYLCAHTQIDTIHFSGADAAFDALVFGEGQEGAERRARHEPVLTKPFSGDIGSVTPVLVVPGPWSDDDLHHHATLLVRAFVCNAAYVSAAPRLIVQHRGWRQRDSFLAAFEQVLARVPTRQAPFPEARRQLDALLNAHARAHRIGQADMDHLPWTIIPDLTPSSLEADCFVRTMFCPAVGELALEAKDAVTFVDAAVEFLNQRVRGELATTILIHPRTLRDRRVRAAFERALNNLQYGTVAINAVAQQAVLTGVLPWGAFTVAESSDWSSSKVANPLMLPRPQKSILRGSFRVPRMFLSVDPQYNIEVCKAITRLEQAPSPWRLAQLLRLTLRR
ncbi:hypothetical protein [Roseiflexus sp.]|uniref:hypothetical protein n=1 Tax=Roseiflexus sp. TaxID=2562120 RepID=UPI00398B066F